ncbi:MAG: prepilin-type N-terminal cleavage/methylation domain-containing protein, partial [Planctomycetota bacterium]|nr:prepilin-type N-terminal cleavage/methylation domain-containing protein [Planctomycetota bacterium]
MKDRTGIAWTRRSAFTLTELLAVMAIVSLLAALLLPTLGSALRTARDVSCVNNQKQMYLIAATWAQDHSGLLPSPPPLQSDRWNWSVPNEHAYFGVTSARFFAAEKYLTNPEMLLCPRAGGRLRNSKDDSGACALFRRSWYDSRPQRAWAEAIAAFGDAWYDGPEADRFCGCLGTNFRYRRPNWNRSQGKATDSIHNDDSYNASAYQGLKTPKDAVAAGLVPNIPKVSQEFPYKYLEYVNRNWPYRLQGPWTANLRTHQVVLSSCYVGEGRCLRPGGDYWNSSDWWVPSWHEKPNRLGGR